MINLRSLVYNAMKANLRSVHVFDARVDNLGKDELPAVVVDATTLSRNQYGPGDYWYHCDATVTVDCFTKAIAGSAATRDNLAEAVVTALFASPEIAQTVECIPSIALAFDNVQAGDTNLSAARVTARFEYSEQFLPASASNPFLVPAQDTPVDFTGFAFDLRLGDPAGPLLEQGELNPQVDNFTLPAPLQADEYIDADAQEDRFTLIR